MKSITFSRELFLDVKPELEPLVGSCFAGEGDLRPNIKNPIFDDLSLEELRIIECKCLKYYSYFLPVLSHRLNEVNHENYDLDYWHSSIGYWLNYVLQYVLIRAYIASKVIAFYGDDVVKFWNVEIDQSDIKFNSTDELVSNATLNDSFSSFVYGRLISAHIPDTWKIENIKRKWVKISLKDSKVERFRFESFAGFYGLSPWEKIFFNFINRIFYIFSGLRKKSKISPFEKMVKHYEIVHSKLTPSVIDDNKFDSNIDFDFFFSLMMPLSFRSVKEIPRPRVNRFTPHLIDSGVRMHAQDSHSFYVADLAYLGRKIALAQHGGLYGSLAVFTTHFIRELCFDSYFSWGWKKCSSYYVDASFNISPYVYRFVKKRANAKLEDKIVFVGTRLPAFVYSLYSMPMGGRSLLLNETRWEFFNNLPTEIKGKVFYKPYPERNEDVLDLCVFKGGELDISLLDGDAIKHVVGARLVIIDHPVTIFLLCVAARIPFIGIWQEDEWPMTGEFQFFLNKLRRDGFIHSDSKDAADWISRNYSDIDLLFNNLDYLDEFSEKFSKVDKKWFFKLVSSVWKFNNI